MNVKDPQISSPGAGGDPLKNEFMGVGNVEQSEVLGRRSHENQIIVLCIVEREQASAFHPNLLVQLPEDMVKVIDRQHLADAGVVIENRLSRIFRRVEIPQTSLGPAHECSVAENDPRLFGT